MASFFRKALGFILLLATIGLATCQSMVNVISEDSKSPDVENTKNSL